MAPLFHIERARYTSPLSHGSLSIFAVGEIIVNRCTFTARHLKGDPAPIAATSYNPRRGPPSGRFA